MDYGHILLYRAIRDNPIYKNSTAFHIWIECLLRASFKTHSFYSKREKIDLKEGQFIMGNREFAQIIGCSVGTVHHWMKQFEAERMTERSVNAKGTIITVLNWSKYQQAERKTGHGLNADRTLREPYNKEIQEKKEKKEDTISKEIEAMPKKEFGNQEINSFLDLIKKETGRAAVAGVQSRRYASSFLKQLKKEYPDTDPLEAARKIICASLSLQDNWHSTKCHDPKHLFYNWGEIVAKVMQPKKEKIFKVC